MENYTFTPVSPNVLAETIAKLIPQIVGAEVKRILQEHFQDQKEKEYITRTEAVNILSLSYAGFYKVIKREKIEVFHIGRKPYYKREEILSLIDPKSSMNLVDFEA